MKTKINYYKNLLSINGKINKTNSLLMEEVNRNKFSIGENRIHYGDSDISHLLRTKLHELHREKDVLVKNK